MLLQSLQAKELFKPCFLRVLLLDSQYVLQLQRVIIINRTKGAWHRRRPFFCVVQTDIRGEVFPILLGSNRCHVWMNPYLHLQVAHTRMVCYLAAAAVGESVWTCTKWQVLEQKIVFSAVQQDTSIFTLETRACSSADVTSSVLAFMTVEKCG